MAFVRFGLYKKKNYLSPQMEKPPDCDKTSASTSAASRRDAEAAEPAGPLVIQRFVALLIAVLVLAAPLRARPSTA